ncbi:uncharacterized protein UV8b_04405 [Ustilaginoidea virens]|uniref:Tafazzin n=1 Tax=Ustilaginoidea virens TaxID=1159556 RepID=A0A8E5HR78_USTVR|nr:uncharacterized protein UV8b_04405 [Ustilaginoidea virens]QUC20164.1 hypothetical protein UV8b_04405 [Ustilaginoidea virens]
MPKKRNHLRSFESCPVLSSPSSSSTPNAAGGKPPKTVNELLANLRHAAGRTLDPRLLAVTSPSVPPAIRELLQIPETTSPEPRRPVRQRFDSNGRRLPAGPAPPRSWVSTRPAQDSSPIESLSRSLRVSYSSLSQITLPGTSLPGPGSLIDIALRRLAVDWDFHRVYNQHHLYFVPNHLKSALIRYVGVASDGGASLADLKTILLPPDGIYRDGILPAREPRSNPEITNLDLSASIGRSLRLSEVLDLLFSETKRDDPPVEEPQDSWETDESSPSPPRLLLPNLTHLSLTLDPRSARDVSWKQLLTLSGKLRTITHLSLAYWPQPCLNPRAKYATISSPQCRSIPYAGTNIYSHSLDHDWSEALLVLRMLSNSFYNLEFLDLTGCAAWFEALRLQDAHDFVDWSGSWGKVTLLRLHVGWSPGADAMRSDKNAHAAAVDTAQGVEKHIRAMRAGKGRFIHVERDVSEDRVA